MKKTTQTKYTTHIHNTTRANLKIKSVKNLNYEYWWLLISFFFFVVVYYSNLFVSLFCPWILCVSRKYHNQRQYLKFELVWQFWKNSMDIYVLHSKNKNIPKIIKFINKNNLFHVDFQISLDADEDGDDQLFQ